MSAESGAIARHERPDCSTTAPNRLRIPSGRLESGSLKSRVACVKRLATISATDGVNQENFQSTAPGCSPEEQRPPAGRHTRFRPQFMQQTRPALERLTPRRAYFPNSERINFGQDLARPSLYTPSTQCKIHGETQGGPGSNERFKESMHIRCNPLTLANNAQSAHAVSGIRILLNGATTPLLPPSTLRFESALLRPLYALLISLSSLLPSGSPHRAIYSSLSPRIGAVATCRSTPWRSSSTPVLSSSSPQIP